MHRSCRLLDFTGWNVGSGLRDRLATKTATTSRSFARGRARQADDGPKDADERFYGYAKKLEVKNQAKDVEADEEEIRQRVYRRTHSPEESVLAVDLVRKHKATKRDAKRLRRMHRETPERTKRLANFKVLPFSHCDPSSDRMVRSIVHQLRKADGVDKETEKMEITDSQLVKLEESEKESVGSLEDLELRHGSPRPPRPDRSNDPLSLPLSRPSLEAFHQVQPDNKDHLDTHFAEWFIGITEAQLPFKVGPNGRPYFALHHSDKQFFRKIRSLLHFGHADDTKEIFYVKDDKHLPCIIHLLNGNLFLQRSRDTFREWVQRYKDLGVWQDEGFVFKETCQWRPQLNNKWLMGWIDSSYGLFAGRLVESGTFPYFRIQLKFWLLSDDRSLLEHMKAIFGGGDIEEDGDWLRWTVRERKLHIRVNRYCRMFKPLSIKNVDVGRYYRLVYYPIAKIRTERAWKKLSNLVRNLNSDERKGALSVECHPYSQRYRENAARQMELAREGATISEVKTFKLQQEKKDFPFWDQGKTLTLIKEVN